MNVARAFVLTIAATLTGCASTHANNPADPLESFNRGVYKFNDTLDKAVAKPVAQGYNAVMPEPGKIMVTNFFSNLDDIIVTANDLLQLKLKQGFSDGMRFLVNTTVGVGGIVDVASMRGLEKHDEDFGQTLGFWGVGNGPYIVLPLLGPSTVRDGVGLYVDSRPSKIRRVKHMRTRNQLIVTKAINRRAQLLDQEKVLDEAAIDRYEFMRDAYLLRRKSQVYDGNPPREKYDEDDGYMKNDTPAAAPVSSNAEPVAPVALEAQPDPQPTVHKIWVAQRTGIR
jgi:phospholipid-binding lipoprotein MlaA